MVTYGDIPLAAIGIVLKAERLPLNVGIGICLGMVPLVAYTYSSKDHQRMEEIIRYSRNVGLLVAAGSIVMYIIRIFIGDAQTIALGIDFLRIRCLATPLMFMSFFPVHLFQAFERGDKALFLGVLLTADVLTVAVSIFVYRNYRRSQNVDGMCGTIL